MPLSKEIKDRIATRAIREYPANQYMSDELFFKRQGQQESYIAGAEVEAEMALGLKECLERLRNHPMTPHYVIEGIDEALTKYNNPK